MVGKLFQNTPNMGEFVDIDIKKNIASNKFYLSIAVLDLKVVSCLLDVTLYYKAGNVLQRNLVL